MLRDFECGGAESRSIGKTYVKTASVYEEVLLENTTHSFSFRELIDRIYSRPEAYLLSGTFIEFSSYIRGISVGLSVTNSSLNAPWVEFTRDWLPQRLKYPHNYYWESVFMDRYPDDEAAIEQLHSLYTEYEAERDKKE